MHWSDPAEAAFKREQIWNPGQLSAGYRYLVRKSERRAYDDKSH